MKKFLMISRLFVISIFIGCCGVSVAEKKPEFIDGKKVTISDPELDYKLHSINLSNNGGVVRLLFMAKPKGGLGKPVGIVRADVGMSGKILFKKNLLEKKRTMNLSVDADLDSIFSGRGTLVAGKRDSILLPTMSGGLDIISLPLDDGSVTVNKVDTAGHSPSIYRVLVDRNESFILLGSIGSSAFISKIDKKGNIISRHLLQNEGVMTAVGAVYEEDGSVTVVGEKGVFPSSKVWVGKISSSGTVLASESFLGRPLDFVQTSDGSYALIFEKSGPEGSEVFLRYLSDGYKERWTTTLMSNQNIVPSFRVSPVSTGGVVAVGIKDRGLWVSNINSDGNEVWTETHNPQSTHELELVANVELDAFDDEFVVAYTAWVIVEREQREVVRVLRFSVN